MKRIYKYGNHGRMRKRMFYNFNNIEIKKPKRIHKRVSLPLLSNEAWALIGAGMVGGVIGATIFTGVIFPFLK